MNPQPTDNQMRPGGPQPTDDELETVKPEPAGRATGPVKPEPAGRATGPVKPEPAGRATGPAKCGRIEVAAAAILAAVAAFITVFLRGYQFLALMIITVAAFVLLWSIRRIRPVLVIVLAVCFVVLAVLLTPIVRAAYAPCDEDRDYIIVMGAAVHGTEPSRALVERLTAAKAYMDEHPDCVAVVSGGMGPGEQVSEARCMRDWLVAHGVDDARIIMEDRATNTEQNIDYSLAIIDARARGVDPDGDHADVSDAVDADLDGEPSDAGGVDPDGDQPDAADEGILAGSVSSSAGPAAETRGSIGLVTSEYHAYRCLYLARRAGIDDPVAIQATTGLPVLRCSYFVREAAAMAAIYLGLR